MKLRLILAISFILCAIAPIAQADSVTLTFGRPGPKFITPTVPPPWGHLTLTLNPDGTVTADLTMEPGLHVLFLDFNVSGSTAGLSVTGLPVGYIFDLATPPNDNQVAGFGDYIASVSQETNLLPVSSLSLTIQRDGGFTSVNQLIELANGTTNPNGTPNLSLSPMAIGVESFVEGHEGAWNAGIGFNPEPGTFSLLAIGLLGLLATAWYKR